MTVGETQPGQNWLSQVSSGEEELHLTRSVHAEGWGLEIGHFVVLDQNWVLPDPVKSGGGDIRMNQGWDRTKTETRTGVRCPTWPGRIREWATRRTSLSR